MVQKLVFDPQTLIDEEKEKEKNKVKEVLTEQEEYDKALEEENAKAKKIEDQEKKKGTVATAFEEIKDILKEVNYAKKYGGKKYLEAKKEEEEQDTAPANRFVQFLPRYLICNTRRGGVVMVALLPLGILSLLASIQLNVAAIWASLGSMP